MEISVRGRPEVSIKDDSLLLRQSNAGCDVVMAKFSDIFSIPYIRHFRLYIITFAIVIRPLLSLP